MDLLGTVAVIVIILIVVSTGAFLLLRHTTSSQLTSAQAVHFVLNDVKASYPDANVTVISVSNSTLKKGSYDIVLSIVYNATRPCPTLFIESFNYPATGLSSSIDNTYTENCTVYGLNKTSVISSPEIAIVRSYDQGIGQITNYVSTFGYNNIVVTANFYSYLNDNVTHLGQSFYNVWLVNYTAKNAGYSVYAVLDYNSSGAVVGNYTAPR